MDQPENDLIFTGQVVKAAEVKTTPAGIPIARFVLAHQSSRSEAGQMRRVECRILVVASGRELTAGIGAHGPGDWLKVRGFLSRAGYRAPETRIELHAMEIQTVKMDG